MDKSRNFSFTIQRSLLDQIQRRAALKGASRNEEMRQLLYTALVTAGERDCDVLVPQAHTERGILWLPCEIATAVQDRGRRFGRATGRELERLMAFAIESNTLRDLAILRAMIEQNTPPAPSS